MAHYKNQYDMFMKRAQNNKKDGDYYYYYYAKAMNAKKSIFEVYKFRKPHLLN